MNNEKIKKSVKHHKSLIENFSYISMLEVFLLIAPLITYPYLVRILGMNIYGVIITAQVLAGYASKIINFGSNEVCAKHVSLNRNDNNKLSEIVSSVLVIRIFLWCLCAVLYIIIIISVTPYRNYWILFLLTYGLTLNEVLFPRYFFQGIEKMKYITFINISIKLLFIIMVFIVVKESQDYLYVPLLYTIGYALAGFISLFVIFFKRGISFYIPPINVLKYYVKDSSPIFATDMICTIKDRFNYFFIGAFSSMENVVIYDLGLKISNIMVKPTQIISTVLFPKFAKNRNVDKFKTVLDIISLIAVAVVIVVNIFLPSIVNIFIHKEIDLWPIRLFTIASLFLSISSFICSNLFVAFSYNKYVLYSIFITTVGYFITLFYFYITDQFSTVYSFVIIALISYFVEFIYRIIVAKVIINKEKINMPKSEN